MAGMKPFSPIRQVDTCEIARRVFGFTSNRLAWLSKHLTKTVKSSHKEFPGFSLWQEVLLDNPRAWAQMKSYNIQDTIATEELYLKLRPWAENQPNVGVYSESEAVVCPKCGSDKLQRRGTSVTQIGKFIRFQCQGCGGWSRSRQMINGKEKRASLLAG